MPLPIFLAMNHGLHFFMQVATPVPDTVPLLDQAAQVTPAVWVALLAILASLTTGVVYVMKAWSDRKNQSLTAELSNLQATRAEALRKDELAATAIVNAPPTIVTVSPSNDKTAESMKVLYIGETDADQVEISKRFRTAGIKNPVVTLDSAQAGLEYLKANPRVVFVIILVKDMERGMSFLQDVKDDIRIRETPVIFLDGASESGKVLVYEGGGAGFLHEPLDFTVLLALLSKVSLGTTISDNK